MMRAASRVELQRNRLSSAEAGLLTSALERTTTLTLLDLSFNDLGDAGVASVCSALAANAESSLRLLDLTYNNFRAEGRGRALGEYVAASTSLVELSVRNNELGDEGCPAVCQMLSSAVLMKLDLSGTKLTPKGAEAVAIALRHNSALTSLSVQDLADDGLRALGVAIHSNPQSRLCSATCDAFEVRPPNPSPSSSSSSSSSSSLLQLLLW